MQIVRQRLGDSIRAESFDDVVGRQSTAKRAPVGIIRVRKFVGKGQRVLKVRKCEQRLRSVERRSDAEYLDLRKRGPRILNQRAGRSRGARYRLAKCQRAFFKPRAKFFPKNPVSQNS